MKKFLVAAALAACVSFVGCKKDDDSSGSESGCFTCSVSGLEIEYCYVSGEDHYTVTMMGISQEVPLGDATWSEIKSGLEAACD